MAADREWPDDAAVEAAMARFLRGATDLEAREDMREILRAAVEASPVVPVPPCPTCGGSPRRGQIESDDLAPFAAWKPCPSCNGSGRDRLIPESEIRARFEGITHEGGPPPHFTLGYDAALEDLLRWLDERERER